MQKIKVWSKFWLETMGEKTSSPLISFCFDQIKNLTKGKPSKNKNVFWGEIFPKYGLFLPELYLSCSQIYQKPWGGWVHRFGKTFPKKASLFGWHPKFRSRNGFDYRADVKDINDYKWCKRRGLDGTSLERCFGRRKCRRTHFKNTPYLCDGQHVFEVIFKPDFNNFAKEVEIEGKKLISTINREGKKLINANRVAKCQFFTQIISIQLNWPQEKARKSWQLFDI